MQAIIDEYQQSQDFLKLTDRTRDEYAGKIKLIEKKYGDLPLAALPEKGTRGEFLG